MIQYRFTTPFFTPFARESAQICVELRGFRAKQKSSEKRRKARNIVICRLMKGYVWDGKNTIYMPRQDIPGETKSLKISHFLRFLLRFTNGLPIFLESQICDYYDRDCQNPVIELSENGDRPIGK